MKLSLLPALGAAVLISPVVSAAESARTEISISESGTIALGGQQITLEELAQRLAKIAAAKEKPEVLIVASEKASVQVLSAVMDLCRKSGITKFSIQSR